MAISQNDVDSFHRFASEKLSNGGLDRSMEGLLEWWPTRRSGNISVDWARCGGCGRGSGPITRGCGRQYSRQARVSCPISMSHYLKFTDEAAEQLFSIAQWYADTAQSLEIAVRWYDGFLDKLETLEQTPLRGDIARENDKFDFELRELHYGSGKKSTHRALYRVVGNAVEVL